MAQTPVRAEPAGDKYFVWVGGLDHGFGGITGADWGRHAPNGDHVLYTQMANLEFRDAHLKKSKRARGPISGRIAWKNSARKRSTYTTSKRYAADFGFRPLRATA